MSRISYLVLLFNFELAFAILTPLSGLAQVDNCSTSGHQANVYVDPTNQGTVTADLSWNGSSDVDAYSIQYKFIGGLTPTTGILYSNETKIINLEPNTTYYWKVRVRCNGVWQNWPTGWDHTFQTPDGNRCQASGHVSNAYIDETREYTVSADLSWDLLDIADEYVLQYSYTGGLTSSTSIISTNNIKITNLEPNTTYFWKVRVKCNGTWQFWPAKWQNSFDTPDGEVCESTNHQANTYLNPNNQTISADLNWEVPSFGEYYSVQYTYPGGITATSNLLDVNQLTLLNLEPNTTYSWKVRVQCNGVWQNWPIGWQNTFETPDGVSCQATGHSANVFSMTNENLIRADLSWDQLGIAEQYVVQYGYDGKPASSSGILSVNNLSLTDLDINKDYHWKVRVKCNGTWQSWPSSWQGTFNTSMPEINLQDISVSLDESGVAVVSATDIDNGSTDPSGISSLTVNRTDFTCSDIGNNEVTVFATNGYGNTSSQTATVSIMDDTPPIVLTHPIAISLDENGHASIYPSDIDAGTADACGLSLVSLNQTTFDCTDVGENMVEVIATDLYGNSGYGTAAVTILGEALPVVVTQDISVSLDETGHASISPEDVDQGTQSACGIAMRELDIQEFDCSHLGINLVTLTVTDHNGNSAQATALVTIIDDIQPTVATQNISVTLDQNGQASIDLEDINNGSFDACGIASISIEPSQFDCSSIGENLVTMRVTDPSGNVGITNAMVTVLGELEPVVKTRNLTVTLDINGEAFISAEEVDNGSSGACGIALLELNQSQFDCSDVGENEVILTVTDNQGNMASETAFITILDESAPVVMAQISQEGKKKKNYSLQYSATDTCDEKVEVSGVLVTPDINSATKRFKRKKSLKKIKIDTKKNKIEIEGPNPQAQFDAIVEHGGVRVSNNQKVELKPKKGHKYEFKYKHGQLVSVSGPHIELLARAVDASGNESTASDILERKHSSHSNGRTIDDSMENELTNETNLLSATVYPNPCRGSFNLTVNTPTNDQNLTIQMFNLYGKLIEQTQISVSNQGAFTSLNMGNESIPKGIYLIQISGENFQLIKRLIITN